MERKLGVVLCVDRRFFWISNWFAPRRAQLMLFYGVGALSTDKDRGIAMCVVGSIGALQWRGQGQGCCGGSTATLIASPAVRVTSRVLLRVRLCQRFYQAATPHFYCTVRG